MVAPSYKSFNRIFHFPIIYSNCNYSYCQLSVLILGDKVLFTIIKTGNRFDAEIKIKGQSFYLDSIPKETTPCLLFKKVLWCRKSNLIGFMELNGLDFKDESINWRPPKKDEEWFNRPAEEIKIQGFEITDGTKIGDWYCFLKKDKPSGPSFIFIPGAVEIEVADQ